MVVGQRLAFLKQCIADGIAVHFSCSSRASQGRAKMKFLIDRSKAPTSAVTRSLLLSLVDAASADVLQKVSVDRGHKHSTGISEVAIWVSDVGDTPMASVHDAAMSVSVPDAADVPSSRLAQAQTLDDGDVAVSVRKR